MQAPRFEGSLLSSLQELKQIEVQRIADERAAIVRAEQQRVAAAADAERRRCEDAEAKLRAEREQQIALEQAKAEAEREGRLRVEAAEAAERQRQIIALAEARQQQELELRRAEVQKKRPTWMVAVTALAVVLAGVLVYFTIGSLRESSEAQTLRIQAERDAKVAAAEVEKQRHELDVLTQTLDDIDVRVAAALKRIEEAKTKAEREAAADDFRREQQRKADAARRADDLRKALALKKRMEVFTVGCKDQAVCKDTH